ncbi:MAG TPA: hypothetical protein P5084_00245 [Paludibacter sp.]|nr:hypothetical protein [Paludibacter sp.]
MENNYISLEKTFDNMEKNVVKKVKKSPLNGIILILIGVACIFLPKLVPTSANSFIEPLMIMLSLIFLIWGFLAAIILKTNYVSSGTNQKIIFKDVFFDELESDKLINMIVAGNFNEIKKLKSAVDRGIKLRLAFTTDRNLCFVQALKYIPYEYVIKTNAVQLSKDNANMLLDSVH